MADFKRNVSFVKVLRGGSDMALFALEVYHGIIQAKAAAVGLALDAAKRCKKTYRLSQNNPPSCENEKILKINQTKESENMKKSNFWSFLAFLAVVCAAIGGVAYYLKKKEDELNEYEDMLFSEDYLADYMPKDEEENSEESCSCCEENPQE